MAEGTEQRGVGDVLVPVGESVTIRQTVAHAVRQAAEAGGTVHFVAAVPGIAVGDVGPAERDALQALLERTAVWAEEDADGRVAVETATVGDDAYLFGPEDFGRVFAEYARRHGIERVLLDPEYSPGGNVPLHRPMEAELRAADLEVSEAPVDRATRRGRLLRRGGLLQFATLFAVSFAFYQLLAGFEATAFELGTGAVSAVVVAGSLHRISLSDRFRLPRALMQVLRLLVYVPYLLYEIVKSNVLVSYVILHPSLPIQPRLTEVRGAVWRGMPVATLANSITLTPGTLTVQAKDRDLVVHTLIPWAREGLIDGGLERWVRFVFYGREAADLPSPRERGDVEFLQDPETGRAVVDSVREGADDGGDGA